MAQRNTTETFFLIACLFVMGISGKTSATTLPTPDIQVDNFYHYYLYDPDPDWWDPAWGPYPDYTIIYDSWTLSQNGPSFVHNSVQPYYDSLNISLTAGEDKKFVFNLPDGLPVANIDIYVLFSVPNGYVSQPDIPNLLPDYECITLRGISGEPIMSSEQSVEIYVSEDGEGIYAHASLPIEHNLEFSRIELSCIYNDGIPYPLQDGSEYILIGKNGEFPSTYISCGGSYTGWYADLPIFSIASVPEPGTALLLGLGSVLLRRYRLTK